MFQMQERQLLLSLLFKKTKQKKTVPNAVKHFSCSIISQECSLGDLLPKLLKLSCSAELDGRQS